MSDRRTLAVVGSVVVALVALVVTVLVAVVPMPRFEALQAGRFTGHVAYQQSRIGSGAASIAMVDLADGTTRSVDTTESTQLVGWDDEGSLILHDFNTDRVILIDPATGTVLDDRPLRPGEGLWDDEAYVSWTHEDGRIVFERAGAPEVSFPAPASYQLTGAAMTDSWVVFADAAGRVAILVPGATPVQVASDAVDGAQVVGHDG